MANIYILSKEIAVIPMAYEGFS